MARPRGGVLLQVGFAPPPSFLFQVGEGGKEEEERRKEGAPPPPLVQFGLGQGGHAPPPGRPSLFSTKAHGGPLTSRGVPVTPDTPKLMRNDLNHSSVQM